MADPAKKRNAQEQQRRLQAILHGAFSGPPTPLKDIPKKSGESRQQKRKKLSLPKSPRLLSRAFAPPTQEARGLDGQPLAFATLDRFNRPLCVADLEIVITKIEFRAIAM